MAGLSVYHDGSPQVSGIGGGGGGVCVPAMPCSDPEAVLRSLFDQIVLDECSIAKNNSHGSMSGGLGIKFVPGPSPDVVYIEFSDILSHWIRKLYGRDQEGGSASSREHIDGLICKILNEKIPKSKGGGDLCNLRGWGPSNSSPVLPPPGASVLEGVDEQPLPGMLTWVREVATDPCNLTASGAVQEWRKWWNVVLNTRRVLLQRDESATNLEEFPYRKKQRTHRFLRETSKSSSISHSISSMPHETLNLPKRRSQRALGLLKIGESHLPRKRIPVGPFFQADVPEWTGMPTKGITPDEHNSSCDSRWLGIRIWPIEGDTMEPSMELIGKGRDDSCSCYSPKSMECIRYHVRMTRVQLMSQLGQAFCSMGFDNMGEEVSSSWSWEEQMNFDSLVRMNPLSEEKTFWYPALRCFPSKSRQSVVSYYFNVHVLRRMSFQTKLGYGKVDSDDDECNGQAYEVQDFACAQRRHCKRKS